MHYKHLHTIISFCHRIKNDKKYHKYNDTELPAESATQGAVLPSNPPHTNYISAYEQNIYSCNVLCSCLPSSCLIFVHTYMSITFKNAQKLSEKSEMYRQTTDVDHGAGSKSPKPQAAAVPWEGRQQHPSLLARGTRTRQVGGVLHGINVVVVQLQATSAPHQNNLTREGECNQKL